MMNEQLDRMAARARAAVEDVAETHADPDGDLAEVYTAAGPLELRRPRDRHPRRWIALAAAAVIVVIGAALVVRQGGDTDPRLVPATPAPQTTPVPTNPGTSTPSTTPPSSGPATTVVVQAPPATAAPDPTTTVVEPTTSVVTSTTGVTETSFTSPLDLVGGCEGLDCPSVDYAADGLPVVYDAASRVLTVLGPTPRPLTLDIPEAQGRIVAVGPDQVAYLVVSSTDQPYPGRIIAVPTSGDRAGTVDELLGPTAGLADVVVAQAAGGIDVLDCCGVGVTDVLVPYVDADGAPLPDDPTLATWSWTWGLDGQVIVHDDVSGQDSVVPEARPDGEGPRTGDLRPLLDGRIVVPISDTMGITTAWVLDPVAGSWTATELGEASVVAIDPLGALLTWDPSPGTYGLVPLD